MLKVDSANFNMDIFEFYFGYADIMMSFYWQIAIYRWYLWEGGGGGGEKGARCFFKF